MRARDHLHAAVLFRRRIDGQPDGDDLHRIEHTLPVVRILVPGDALAVALGFADEVAGEERDVRAEDGLNQVENVVGEQPAEELRVGEVRLVHGLGTLARGEGREDALRLGGDVADSRVGVRDVLATLYQHLGIDAAEVTLTDTVGRPVPVLPEGRPILRLLPRV